MAHRMSMLKSATANGASAVKDIGFPSKTYGLQVILGGTVVATGGTVKLNGSLDGTNWFTLITWTIGTDTNKDIKFAVDKPVTYLQAVLAGLTGGTEPTVTAIASAG